MPNQGGLPGSTLRLRTPSLRLRSLSLRMDLRPSLNTRQFIRTMETPKNTVLKSPAGKPGGDEPPADGAGDEKKEETMRKRI